MPLYALHSQRSLGSGDFGDLEAFSNCVERLGGSFVATLPFLAAFLDEPMEPSPYQPVSRLFGMSFIWTFLSWKKCRNPERPGIS